MVKPGKDKRGVKSNHKIDIVDYSEDYLRCICGWVGFAVDKLSGTPDYAQEKDYPYHRRNAPQITNVVEETVPHYYGNTRATTKKIRVVA